MLPGHIFWILLFLAVTITCPDTPSLAMEKSRAQQCGHVQDVRGLRFVTLEDGAIINLEGIAAEADRPELLTLLQTLLTGERVCVSGHSRLRDRHQRLSGHVYRERDGLWIQKQLVSVGLTFTVPAPELGESARALLMSENRARMDQRGLWRDSQMVKQADSVGRDDRGTFRIVEGIIQRVTRREKGIYLDFGENWRNDFSVLLPPTAGRRLERSGVVPEHLRGQNVRVRGWVHRQAGHLITLTEPEFLEILSSADLPSPH